MPRIFAITAAKDRIDVDAGGRAEMVYTVTNITARPVRGRARVVALESTKQAWLTIAGETERDFSAHATHQYAVQAAVPPGTPPGTYRFRLDADSATNPTEDFDEGPAVALQIPEPKPVAPPSPWPWWLKWAIAAGVLLVAGVIGYFLLKPDLVEVPPVVGKLEVDAKAELKKAELEGEVSGTTTTPANPPPAGTVTAQKPEAGTEAEKGSVVSLTVEEPPKVTVPSVIGQEPGAALLAISQANLNGHAVMVRTANPKQVNRVIGQDPQPGEPAAEGSTVTVNIGVRVILPIWELLSATERDALRRSRRPPDFMRRIP